MASTITSPLPMSRHNKIAIKTLIESIKKGWKRHGRQSVIDVLFHVVNAAIKNREPTSLRVFSFDVRLSFKLLVDKKTKLDNKPIRNRGYMIPYEYLIHLTETIHALPRDEEPFVIGFFQYLGISFTDDRLDSEPFCSPYTIPSHSVVVTAANIPVAKREDVRVPQDLGFSFDTRPAKRPRTDSTWDAEPQPTSHQGDTRSGAPAEVYTAAFPASKMGHNTDPNVPYEGDSHAIISSLRDQVATLREERDYFMKSGLLWKKKLDELEARVRELEMAAPY